MGEGGGAGGEVEILGRFGDGEGVVLLGGVRHFSKYVVWHDSRSKVSRFHNC